MLHQDIIKSKDNYYKLIREIDPEWFEKVSGTDIAKYFFCDKIIKYKNKFYAVEECTVVKFEEIKENKNIKIKHQIDIEGKSKLCQIEKIST